MTTVEPYDPERDASEVIALWQAVLGTTWPLTERLLTNAISNRIPGQQCRHFVARANGAIVGFTATQLNSNRAGPPGGNLAALIVAPHAQRQGIGTALHAAALAHLRQAGAQQALLSSKYPRLWPGIPANLSEASGFFRARGWILNGQVVDLVRNLADFSIPESLHERMTAEHIILEPAAEQDVQAILTFEGREFGGWLDTYKYIVSIGDYRDFLVARDLQKGIVGTLLMYSPQSHPQRVDALWKPTLGENLGGLGEVGVAASERGRGIGVALVAWGSEILKQRGVGNAFVGFTTRADFYGKLGYKTWQIYDLNRRDL